MNIIMIESCIILIFTIPLLFRLKNWMYRKQDLEIKKWEEYIFLMGGFTCLFLGGIIFKSEYLRIISLAFIFWILYDVILYDIELWKTFLNIIKRR